jgi:Salmonella virulence plasmid 65kDa B protein
MVGKPVLECNCIQDLDLAPSVRRPLLLPFSKACTPDARGASPPAASPTPPPPPSPTPSPAPASPSPSPSPAPATPANPPAAPLLTPSAQTGPDIQPTVYSSFNQNQVKIDKNTGALQTTYPISIPPGRNGLQPNLDLVYNSQNVQQGSVFGEGWSIGIPYIERLNKSGVDNLYSTSTLNYFSSSLDGELVSTSTVTSTGSSYVARTENGAFNKYTYTSSTNQWTMIDKNGTSTRSARARMRFRGDPNNSAHVYRWMLKTITDTNNNTVLYNYVKDSGQVYPSSTMYTGNGTSTGIFEVDFALATTTLIDNATSSATGFAVNSNYRVSEIDAKANGTWVRKYVLGYKVGDNGYTTVLGSIAQSGENASGTVASLPSSTLAYELQTPGWTSSSTWNPPTPFVSSSVDLGVRIANLTGNGLPAILGTTNSWVDTANGWTSSSTWNLPVSFTTSSGGDNGYRLVDLTGNGRADIISGTTLRFSCGEAS